MLLGIAACLTAAEDDTRSIRLIQDDAQIRMVSKIYPLKYVKATDIRPYINAIVKRYNKNSYIERVVYIPDRSNSMIVSTGEDFMPYVDDIIAKLDRPGTPDQYGSIINGTGITKIAYTPNYRSCEDIARIINVVLRSGAGIAFQNPETNTIYWKDDQDAAMFVLGWMKNLDRPLPQANIKLKYYEVRESRLKDLGIDYLAWKNGPGLNLFEVGYDAGKVISTESMLNSLSKFADLTKNFSSSWSFGGFFTAPQFDMSFVRCLQQSGNAKLAAAIDINVVNTPIYTDATLNKTKTYTVTLIPDYQNIKKDDNDRSDVVTSDKSSIGITITNPVICFNPADSEVERTGNIPQTLDYYNNSNGNVIFNYELRQSNVVERNNRGMELGNFNVFSGEVTLGMKAEKVLATYLKENDVEQTIGIPFLIKIPYLKYLFGTTTTLKERTYIIVTADAEMIHPDKTMQSSVAANAGVVIVNENNEKSDK